jgi:hypothetical protein
LQAAEVSLPCLIPTLHPTFRFFILFLPHPSHAVLTATSDVFVCLSHPMSPLGWHSSSNSSIYSSSDTSVAMVDAWAQSSPPDIRDVESLGGQGVIWELARSLSAAGNFEVCRVSMNRE